MWRSLLDLCFGWVGRRLRNMRLRGAVVNAAVLWWACRPRPTSASEGELWDSVDALYRSNL